MSGVNVLETIVDPEFYETIDNYKPREEDFLDLVREMVPSDWQFVRNNGVWFGCLAPEGKSTPSSPQGWKIHVSSSAPSAKDVLKAVVPILSAECVNFKFSLDLRILSLMNSKRWVRQGAGKFITIYPVDEGQFIQLMEKLHHVTKQFQGPYILSDRRYKDSRVLFYRYGGIAPYSITSVKGVKTSMLISPSGETIPDIRYPYFFVPSWTKDPFEGASTEGRQEQTNLGGVSLKNGRYLVKSALSYSNSGGVYVAEDTETGRDVVIKEARPLVDSSGDTVSLLKKEYRILSKIAHLKVAPAAVDFFQDWEHFFLVQEFIQGYSLSSFSARNNITLYTHPTLEDTEKFYRDFKTIFLQLAKIMQALHESGIVFSDLSPSNLIILRDTLELKIIDFEGAHEIGVDQPATLYTPGFAYADQMFGSPSTFESDYFSLGAIMHFFLSPVNQIFLIHPRARYTFIENVTKDIGFPKSICEVITALIDKAAEKRPAPGEVIRVLEREEEVSVPNFAVNGPEADPIYCDYVQGITEYILATATYDRKDRLFPADGRIFRTNPLSIAHGACGVAYAIKKIKNQAPEEALDWILARNKNRELYPPGLYLGLSGIAWAMLELGLGEESRKVLSSTYDHPSLYNSFDIYYGVAGWGMANLRFYMEFQDEMYLQKAEEAGVHLLKNASTDERGCYWSDGDEIPLGYAHGASGVSLFLLYLYLASGKERFLDAGLKAVDFDINNATYNPKGGGVSWRRVADKGNIVYPYWVYGSAGVGMAVLRYCRLLGEEKHKDALDKIHNDTSRKYSVYPGFFKGLAGKGEFLLDLYQFTGMSCHLDSAYKVATGISFFKIDKKQGLAFPGETLRRISCDYGTGSAGIGHFLHRLTRGGEGGFNLDRLFDNNQTGVPPKA
jgi:serine/threonine protein kinase